MSESATKVKWTSGKWHLHDMEAFTVCGPDHLAIALCEAKSRSLAENGANTFLIAKAPEMAELLCELVSVLQSVTEVDDGVCYFNGRYMGNLEKPLERANKLLAEIE